MENCPNCGTKLKETSWRRKYCPNCGIIDDSSETKVVENPSYVG